MKTVHKVQLYGHNHTACLLPEDAKFLHVAEQHGEICVWFLTDTSTPRMKERRFLIAGTGHPIHESIISHLGTILTHNGGLVWHVFEVAP